MYVKDGITGLLIGDALGVPHEFKTRQELQLNPVTTMTGYGTWNQPIGTWSDDTSMTLATMNSIIKNKGKINLDNMMHEFVRWYANGEYTQDGECFDCGNTTSQAIMNYVDGADVYTCGLGKESNNGNGSLMRILPLAFLPNIELETVEMVSSLTHSHIRSRIACSLYVEIAKEIMKGGEDTFCDYVAIASDTIQDYYRGENELRFFQRIFDVDYSGGVTGRIHVVDTLETAIYSIRVGEGFEDTLLRAVNMGNDTDTVGAVTGGLAGLYYGFESIPSEWLECVRGLDYVFGLCDGFEEVIG